MVAGDPKQIAMLEALLERAKRGDVLTVGYVAVEASGEVSVAWRGEDGQRLKLIGGISLLIRRIEDTIIVDDKPMPSPTVQ